MSGVVRSVTKVFKSVTKSTVGKVVVAAAAAYFTAGLGSAVLGATGLSGSLSATMGTVLSHAISGAAAGALTSAITGQNIGKGLALGGVGGAVVGGVQSALGNFTPGDWAKPPTEAANQVQNTVQQVGTEQAGAIADANMVNAADASGAANQMASDAITGAPSTASASNVGLLTPTANASAPGLPMPPPPRPEPPGLFEKGGFLDRNPSAAVVGAGAVSGLGSGAVGMLGAKSTADAAKEKAELEAQAERDKAARIAASHSNIGLLTPSGNQLSNEARPTPSQKFDPRTYGGQFKWNPQSQQIEWVPNQGVA